MQHTKYFIGIEVLEEPSETLHGLQRKMTDVLKKRRNGYDGVVTHGASPFHITLFAPTDNFMPQELEGAMRNAACEEPNLRVSLSQLGQFSPNTVYLACERGADTLKEIAEKLHQKLRLPVPKKIFHVSLARKYEAIEHVAMWAAAQRVREAYPNLFPIEFFAYALKLFYKSPTDDRWRVMSSVRFGCEDVTKAA